MSAEAVRTQAARASSRPLVNHVLICGATEASIEIALLLRRFGEAVTLLSDDVRGEQRQSLERAGVRVVIGPANDRGALTEAGIMDARAAVIAPRNDLVAIEILLALHAIHPALPLVCHVHDEELATRTERGLGVRTAVCVATIEASHLAGCALSDDIVGAFSLDEHLVILRRRPGSLVQPMRDQRDEVRILMVEEREGRCVLAPSPAMPIPPDSVVTTIERVPGRGPVTKPPIVRAIAHTARSIRGNTPRPLVWTAAVLMFFAAASVFVFMSGMSISFGDAAYLVLNTISTVGYGDITPFGSGRAMHFFGSFVALLGPALLGTLLLIFARIVLRPQRVVPPSSGHVIIVAPPAVAGMLEARLSRLSIECVIASPDSPVERSLREANAASASALIAATTDAVKNVTLGLGARELNPSIRVVAGGPAKIAREVAMTVPVSAFDASISLAASAALVAGLRYAITIGDRVFSFFEGTAGTDWGGQRPSDVSGSYNFVTLFRRVDSGQWQAAGRDTVFAENETILVAAWRRLESPGQN